MTTSADDSSRHIEHSFFKAADTPTAGRRFAHRVALLAALAAMPCIGLAHEMEAPLEATPAMAAMRYCQTQGVRAAWGAQARFLGGASDFQVHTRSATAKDVHGRCCGYQLRRDLRA